jgi:hypothetical protein
MINIGASFNCYMQDAISLLDAFEFNVKTENIDGLDCDFKDFKLSLRLLLSWSRKNARA